MTPAQRRIETQSHRRATAKYIKGKPMNDMTQPEADAHAEAGYRAVENELRQFVERIERLDAEKKDLAELQKEVMAEAKYRGYDTKILRKVIALRKRDKDDIAEEKAVMEMYTDALGMEGV